MDQSNKKRAKHVMRALGSVELGAREQLLPFGLPVVDAGLWEFFITQRKVSFLRAKRQGMTTGSARYILTLREGPNELAEIQVRTISDQATHISISPGSLVRQNEIEVEVEEADGVINELLWIFASWLKQDYISKMDILDDVATKNLDLFGPSLGFGQPLDESSLEELSQRVGRISPSPIGRPRDIDNDWVRSEVQKGRDRDEVFEEYLIRQRVQPDNKAQRDRARDRFRKALNRMEGNK